MEPPVQPQKVVQVSQQVFNPVQIPLIINNQMFLMVQQDIRWIEETRHISYKKLTPEGHCIPIEGVEMVPHSTALPHNLAANYPQTGTCFPPCLPPHSTAFPHNPTANDPLVPISFPPCLPPHSTSFPQNIMDSNSNAPGRYPNVMDWTVCGSPVHSESTSTSDLSLVNNRCSQPEHCVKLSVGNESSLKSCLVKNVSFQGVNTDYVLLRDDSIEELSAMERIKLKKMNESSSV